MVRDKKVPIVTVGGKAVTESVVRRRATREVGTSSHCVKLPAATSFPDGLTVIDGGGQWRGPNDTLIRESSKIVFLVLPKGDAGAPRLNTVREAYKTRFKQDSVLLITQPACVSF